MLKEEPRAATLHPLVAQLHFARSEWRRGLEGVTEEEARRHLLPMNSIGWMVGHLAWHEHLYWVIGGQGKNVLPELDELVGNGRPASTPPLGEMWAAWSTVIRAADRYLATLAREQMPTHMVINGRKHPQSIGTMVQRVIYNYWYHIGESQAVRQLLGHRDLPQFVGDIQGQAPYRPEE